MNLSPLQLFAPSAVLLLSSTVARAITPTTDLIYGHYEINIDYQPVTSGDPDDGWIISASYDEDDDFSSANGLVRLSAETTRFLAAPNNLLEVPEPAGVFSRFGPPGTPIWVLPQDNIIGSNFLGIRTTMPPNERIFQTRVGNNYSPQGQGTMSLRLVSVTGTGPDADGKFATWKTETFGNQVFSFDTTDGIGSADEIPTIPVYSHTHYNWGMTRPGTYAVTFEASARLLNGQNTSAQQTFTFVVPFSGVVGTGGQIRVAAGSSGPLVLLADPAMAVGYKPDRAILQAELSGDSSAVAESWELQLTASSDALPLANGVGVDPEVLSAGLGSSWSNVTLQLLDVEGPGAFTLSAAGEAEVIAVAPGSETNLTARFSAPGLYRATFIPRATRDGQDIEGDPVTLVFAAGVGPDYDYATWQSSFERTAGLPAGALADGTADYDRDGVPNQVEYAFFWQGMDPTKSDADRMPKAAPTSEGFGAIQFLRDTWKDPYDETNWQIRPQSSTDLISWSLRSARVPGFPLETFETGAEEGNAFGPIMRRQLRVMPSPQRRMFFRFQVTSPQGQ